MAAPLGPNEKPHVSPARTELPTSADTSSQNVIAAASEAINELSQVASASSSTLRASQAIKGSEVHRIEGAVDYFSKIIKAVKQQHIYSSFSPSEIALLRSVSRQENATVMHSHQFSIEIVQLLDYLSQKVINSNDYIALVPLIQLQTNLEEVKKFLPIAKKIDDPNLKKYVLESIAKKQASLKDIDGEKETAALIKGEHSLYAILLAQIEKAKETVKKMYYKNSYNESHALSKIALAQAKAQDFEGAIQTNRLIDNKSPLKEANLINIIQEQTKAKDYEGAKVTANKFTFFKKSDVYAKIAEEQIIHHDYEAAKLTINEVAYLAMSQKKEEKLKLLSYMAKEQLQTQNLKEVQQTFILAKEVAYQLPLSSNVLRQFSKLQIDFNDIEAAKENLILARATVQEVNPSFKYRINNWIEIATLQITCGDWKEANLTLDFAKGLVLECESPQDYKNRILGEVSALQASARDIVGAKDTVNFIEHPSQKAKALSEIAGIQTKNGDIIGAKKTVELVNDMSYQTFAYETIALQQAKSQDHLGAIATINLMRSSFNKNLAFQSVANEQIEIGYYEAALISANQMTDLIRKNLVLQKLAIKQAELAAFEKAKIMAHEITDFSIKTHTLIEIASQQIKALDFSGARETLAQAKTIENYPERAKCLALIIKQEVKFNKSDALATFKILKTLVKSVEFVPSLNKSFFYLMKELHSIVY